MIISAISLGQSNIQPFRQQQTGPATVMHTGEFSPQINPRFEHTARPLSPNSSPRPIPNGTSNSLKAGNVTTKINSKLGPKFPAIGFTGFVPPDPDLAVGPNHIVAVVNSDVAFFNKATGAKTFQQPGDGTGFFSGIGVQSSFTFDPKCYFDRLSQRFFVLFLEADFGSAQVSKILLAVSDDADPNGTWFKYRIETKVTDGGNSFWLDYPGFGVNKDAVVFTGNMFPFASGGVFTSIGVVPKAPLLTGASANVSYLRENSTFTLQPARTADPTQSIMYAAASQTLTSIRLVAIRDLLGTPTMSIRDVPVPAWQRPTSVPSGGGRLLDGLDGRLYNCHFRAGRLVTAHTTRNSDGRMKVRWYEFAVNSWPSSGNPALRQSGDVLLTGVSTHMPAVNTNAAGDISVIYSRSGASLNPETVISSRFAADPLGSMGAPTVLATSAGTYGGAGVNRWGDYFGCEIDPVDNLTFWGIGMVGVAGGNWTTHINKWSVSSGSAATLIDPLGVNLISGNLLAGNLASITASDNNRYSIQSYLIDKNGNETSNGAIATGQAASMQVDFDLDLSEGTVIDLKAVVEANIITTGATGQIFAWDWASSTFKSVGSFALGTIDKTSTITIPKAQLPSYVNGAGNVRLMIRGFSPVRAGRPVRIPAAFTLGVDRVALAPGFQS